MKTSSFTKVALAAAVALIVAAHAQAQTATPTVGEATATVSAPTNTAAAATNTPGSATNTPASATNTPGGATNTPGSATNTPGSATNTPGGATTTPGGPTATPTVAPTGGTPAGARDTIEIAAMTFGNPGETVKFPVSLTVVSVATTLSAAIDAAVTTIPLASVANFPSVQANPTPAPLGSVKIENEVVTYTGITGTSLTGVTRGAGGTTAAAHASGTAAVLQGVAGTQNDITFDPNAPIASTGGSCAMTGLCCTSNADCTTTGDTCAAPSKPVPACCVNPTIMKSGSSFAFEPPNCTGTACTGIRALILSTSNVAEINSGSRLYSCAVAIPSSAALGTSFALTCSGPGSSDPTGVQLTTACTNGAIVVGQPTATATVGGNTPTPTKGGATATPGHATNTPTPRRTGIIPRANDDDACAIVSPAGSQAGWMLLLPAAMLLWVRRRSR